VLNLFPDVPVIDRPGIISAWDDPKFVAAIEKTGRKNLIIAGVTVDVCLAFAAMQAVDAGYYVYGVVDASGALDTTTRELAIARERVGGCDAAKAPKLDADEKAQAKKANAAARLWISGIEALQRIVGHPVQVYDLSATPFFLRGSGYDEGELSRGSSQTSR
jgi:hypothetical protein